MKQYRIMVPGHRGPWGGTSVAETQEKAEADALMYYNKYLIQTGRPTVDKLPPGTVCVELHP